jgi:predicted AAA+ superfamily ATPase
MIRRELTNNLLDRLTHFPAVALVGPRQCGKTTLAKSLDGAYFDLEKPQDRLRLDVQWESAVSQPGLVVLDEAQAMPDVFPRLRSAIDDDRKRNGRFLLLGSISPSLMKRVGESLAGRLALCELSPLVASELSEDRWDDLWRMGGYPDGGILDPGRYPEWEHAYLQLMSHRDLPNWGLPAQALVTQRLFRMLAALHGQTWQASQIGRSLGLTYHTVNSYVDFLESAFLIRRLPAYSANLKKRLVKSPKVYWRDSGLLHALLDLGQNADIYSQPWVGASWEGWIIEQMIGLLHNTGQSFQAFHLRTSDGYEIDLLLQWRGQWWAFEIKLTSVPDAGDLQRLKRAAQLVPADHAVLISRTSQSVWGEKEASVNLAGALQLLRGEATGPAGSA